jgi:thymidylate kinase
MYKTIVIEGGDGVGKTTLARETARQITALNAGYEGFYTRFPSDAIAGFRDFFLGQKGCRPLLENNEVVWSGTYASKIPPLSNLLHVLADFSYAFAALRSAPDVAAAAARGAVPVFVIDRELLSTVVYQVMYAFDQNKAAFDYIVAEKIHLFNTLRTIVTSTVVDKTHDLLVHVSTAGKENKLTPVNSFDLYDQRLIQKYFADLFDSMQQNNTAKLPFLAATPSGSNVNNLTWLKSRFKSAVEFKSFSKSSDKLGKDLAQLFLEKMNEPSTVKN